MGDRLHGRSHGGYPTNQHCFCAWLACHQLCGCLQFPRGEEPLVQCALKVSDRSIQSSTVVHLGPPEWLGQAWTCPTLVLLHSAHSCVCLLACLFACLRPCTVNFKWVRSNFNIMKIKLMQVGEAWRATARVQHRLHVLGVETTEVEVHWQLTPCLLQIIDGRLPTGSTNFDHDRQWLRSLQVLKGYE